MSEQQTELGWPIVEKEMEKNQQPRINWKAIIGMSLTRAIARFKAAGLTADMTYDTLLFENPNLTQEMKRRLRIGVCARFGEMSTAQSELKKVNHG